MSTARRKPTPNGNRPTSTTPIAESHLSGYRAEDRAIGAARELLHANGYGTFTRCLDCRHPITAAASLGRMRDPKCAAKAVGE